MKNVPPFCRRLPLRVTKFANRRGAIIVLSAAMLIMILAFVAFSVDVGYLAVAKGQLQNAADASALAGAMELNSSGTKAEVLAKVRAAAADVADQNRVGDLPSLKIDPAKDVVVGLQTFDPVSKTSSTLWGDNLPNHNVVKVFARRTGDQALPLFFAPVIGHNKSDLETYAIATFQQRDIVVVLDYSASMNDDSEFKAISKLGKQAVEDNIYQMWEDLGKPAYGKMGFDPEFITAAGQPEKGAVPHVKVTWKGTEVFTVSTKDLSNVVLKFTDGTTQKHDNLKVGTKGSFAGTGKNSNKTIETAWIKSGNNNSGDGPGYGERFDFDVPGIRKWLDLNSVAYPGAEGSWDAFIHYVKNTKSSEPYYSSQVANAGYRYKFGIMSLINFWNEKLPQHDQTPFLWQVSQQPITLLKDSVDLFVDYLEDHKTSDRVGLSVYTYPDSNGAFLESGLTTDRSVVKTLSRQRQAGHYEAYTNIGAGMRMGRLELAKNSSPRALKMMVLMTDGLANKSSTKASPNQFVVDEAKLAADAGIKIMTISLGADADVSYMKLAADLTGGKHFIVPGGSNIEQYSAALKKVFEDIAADRPLKLIGPDK